LPEWTARSGISPADWVVDYIGIAESLRAALADYTDRDQARQEVGAPVEEALALLEENHQIHCELLYGCPWREALDSGSDRARIEAIMAALQHLLGAAEMDLPDRFLHRARVAFQAFTLAVSSPEAMRFRDDLAFFQAVARTRGSSYETDNNPDSPTTSRSRQPSVKLSPMRLPLGE
jgi:type I restriction enzyme, R subunit